MLCVFDYVLYGVCVVSGIGLVWGGWWINFFEYVCGYVVVCCDVLLNCNFVLFGVYMFGLC